MDWWTSRVHSKGQDPFGLGRWSFITLWGAQDILITIISAYRFSQKSSSSLGVKYDPDLPTLDKLHNRSLHTLAMTCGLIDVLATQHSARPSPQHIFGERNA